ncbi:MAG: hypothetical protein ABSA93_27305 [Streptosporangiaceae bacterium]
MTTPSNSGGGNVTQNQLNITQQAQEAFQTAVGDMNSILGGVEGSNNQLITAAMVSTAGGKLNGAVVQWLDDFNALKNSLQNIADQLETQWKTMLQNEQNNTDLASGVIPVSVSGIVSQTG